MTRLSFLIVAGLAFGTLTTPIARAQDYPTRQITLIAPWPAGGAVDALCRAVAPHLSDRLGKSVVVENRPGAGSVIGTAAGAKAAPDGYTVVMAGSGSLAISAALYKKLPTIRSRTSCRLCWPAGFHSFSWSTHRCRCARSPSS